MLKQTVFKAKSRKAKTLKKKKNKYFARIFKDKTLLKKKKFLLFFESQRC